MDKIIAELQWSENDVFVDLGSGIGSIVMQVNCYNQTLMQDNFW